MYDPTDAHDPASIHTIEEPEAERVHRYTEGDWRASPTYAGQTLMHTGAGRRIAAILHFGTCDWNEMTANARLMAAAPSMLAALIAAEEYIVDNSYPYEPERMPVLTTIRTAIHEALDGSHRNLQAPPARGPR